MHSSRFSRSCTLLLLLAQILTLTHALPPFNISHFLYPKSTADDLLPHPSPFLKDVLEAIGDKEKWDVEDVRVNKLELNKARHATMQRNELRVKFGKTEFSFKLFDRMSQWKRFHHKLKVEDSESGLLEFEGSVKEIVGSKAVLDTFKIEGPFELRISGDDYLSLMLPLNISHRGLKQIVVSEGITLEVMGAEEVTLSHASALRQQVYNGGILNGREWGDSRSFTNPVCVALLPIRVVGSVSIVAYRTRNPDAQIETAFRSGETIELLPEKCYVRQIHRKRGSQIDSLSRRIALLENILGSLVGSGTKENTELGIIRANIKATSILRFQLQLERDIGKNDTYYSTLAEWRTRPTIERVWFEVVARIEGEVLKPITVKKVRPFIEVDSLAWSNLMSNISFTKFPSLVVPPEALTLDVKW